jgi:hypothetical protein
MKPSKLSKALSIAGQDLTTSKPSSLIERIPTAKRIRTAKLPDRAEHSKQSLDKHGGSLRYKAAYAADLLAEDIISVFRRSGKKDKEYLKGLVWSFGVLFDKATGGQSTDAVTVRIPAKLLENVSAVIAIQVGKHAAKPQAEQVPQDAVSCAGVIESTGYTEVVAPEVAPTATQAPSELDLDTTASS